MLAGGQTAVRKAVALVLLGSLPPQSLGLHLSPLEPLAQESTRHLVFIGRDPYLDLGLASELSCLELRQTSHTNVFSGSRHLTRVEL